MSTSIEILARSLVITNQFRSAIKGDYYETDTELGKNEDGGLD